MKSLLLVALFISCALAANTCVSPMGVWVKELGLCSCFSGFEDGPDGPCSVPSKCAGIVISANAAADHAPMQPTITFSDDKLTIVQRSPIVHGRRNSSIVLSSGVDAPATCNYPGDIWTKSVDHLDCMDIFTAVLPWSQHEMCGFSVESNTAESEEYGSTLIHKYSDEHMRNGAPVVRDNLYSNHMTVKFAKKVSAQLDVDVEGFSSEGSVVDVQISTVTSDPDTGNVDVHFQTAVESPFVVNTASDEFHAVWVPFSPSQTQAPGTVGYTLPSITLVQVNSADVKCGSQDELCAQGWKLVFNPGSVCNIRGSITVFLPLQCRDGQGDSPAHVACAAGVKQVTIQFKQDTDVCASEEVSGSDLTASLRSFSDDEVSEPSTTFKVGQTAYFIVDVKDSQSTIETVHITSIMLGSSTVYDSATAVPIVGGGVASSDHVVVSSEPTKIVSPGSPAEAHFQLALKRDISEVSSVATNPAGASIMVSVSLDVSYHGNERKRMVLTGAIQKSASLKLRLTSSDAADAESVVAEQAADATLTGAASKSIASVAAVLVTMVAALLF